MTDSNTPPSPEEYPRHVREELHQTDVSHDGKARTGDEGVGNSTPSSHFGATEDEVSSVTPPMEGPSKLIEGSTDDMGIDPHEELHDAG